MEGLRYPDLLIAFDVDPAAYYRSNAYIISEQGKPPDFVLEIASHATGRQDTREKRDAYAALGIPEYWRFDETGRYHRTRLAGWPATGWWMACTCPYPLRDWRKVSCRVTARH